MLKFLERRWAELAVMIVARQTVRELRSADEARIVENFFASAAWKKVLEISMTRVISIKGSFGECVEVYVSGGQLLHCDSGSSMCFTSPLTANHFHSTLTHPNMRLYRGSIASVLRKFIGDTDRALLRLA